MSCMEVCPARLCVAFLLGARLMYFGNTMHIPGGVLCAHVCACVCMLIALFVFVLVCMRACCFVCVCGGALSAVWVAWLRG